MPMVTSSEYVPHSAFRFLTSQLILWGFQKVVTQRILPNGPSVDMSFRIALHQTPETRTSDWMGVRFSQLHLVKFREPVPGDDHWIAEIDIVPGY